MGVEPFARATNVPHRADDSGNGRPRGLATASEMTKLVEHLGDCVGDSWHLVDGSPIGLTPGSITKRRSPLSQSATDSMRLQSGRTERRESTERSSGVTLPHCLGALVIGYQTRGPGTAVAVLHAFAMFLTGAARTILARASADDPIALLGGMLIAQCRVGRAVPHAGHQLPSRGACSGGPRVTGVSEIVEMQFGAAGGQTSSCPMLLQHVGTEQSAFLPGEHQGVCRCARIGVQMCCEHRK